MFCEIADMYALLFNNSIEEVFEPEVFDCAEFIIG